MMRESGKKIVYTLTLKGKPLMAFFLTPSKNGLIFGMETPHEDTHLTIIPTRTGKIGSHITDPSKQIQQPWDAHYSSEFMAEEIGRLTKGWLRKLHPNHLAYVMTPRLKTKLRRALYSQKGERGLIMPIEVALGGEIRTDFENPRRWKKVKIRDLPSMNENLAFRREDGTVKYVLPAQNGYFLSCTERQYWKFLELCFKPFGLDEYLEYVAPKQRKPLRQKLNKILGRQSKLT